MKSLAWFLTILVMCVLPAHAQTTVAPATTPREQLTLLVKRLSEWPGDYDLRERIMKLAQEIKPLPAIPEEAQIANRLGETLYSHAKPRNPEEFREAVDAFRRATTLAPWWADAYYNQGVAEERANLLAAADRSFGIYLLSKPDSESVRTTHAALDRIEKTELLMGKQIAAESISAEELLDALHGATYDCGRNEEYFYRINIRNRYLSDTMVAINPLPEVKPIPNTSWLKPAGPAPAPASDRRSGLIFFKPSGGVHTVSPNQVDRKGTAPCRRIRGYR
ncbi:MAG TPA: hypothetical protein VIB00_01130 [Pyrinomonadaceae bacterium]|jgi:tetratricopeptide (TPR) repeat protein